MTSDQLWRGGDRVEIKRVVSGAVVYFTATVINAPSVRKKLVWVEHEDLMCGLGGSVHMKEYVIPTRLRPSPPRELNPRFKAGDDVDIFRDGEGCWVRGNVMNVVGNSRYIVEFNGFNRPVTEVDHFNLRIHREWDNASSSWIPSFPQQESMPKPIKLKIKFRSRDECEKDWINGQWLNPSKREECDMPPLKKLKSCEIEEKVFKFNNGMMVEVRSDEQGYEGSWFSAKILNYLGKNRYTVEYQTLKTEDQRELLKEEAKGSDIRPTPPLLIQRECQFELNEKVDAWFNEGWWSGQVYKIDNKYNRYGVYFNTTDEKLEFAFNDLRPSQVWRKGKWTRA